MEKKGDFKHGRLVSATWVGVSISETADLLGFSSTTISYFYRELAKKKKIPQAAVLWKKMPCQRRSEKNVRTASN